MIDKFVNWTTDNGKGWCELQAYVRSKFHHTSEEKLTNEMMEFIASVVSPSMKVVPYALNEKNLEAVSLVCKKFKNCDLKNISDLEMSLCKDIKCGAIRNHPLIQGMLVAALEKWRRRHRGVETMRNCSVSEIEKQVMKEAGMSIAIAGHNKHFIRKLGLQFADNAIKLDSLPEQGLMDPNNAIEYTDRLQMNGHFADTIFPRKKTAPYRRLAAKFDNTYLRQELNIVKTVEGIGLVGGCWRPKGDPIGNQSFIPLGTTKLKVDLEGVERAAEMFDFVIMDSTRTDDNTHSLCNIPMSHKASSAGDDNMTERGKWEVIHNVGKIMYHAGKAVKVLSFDNHASHAYVKKMLLGHNKDIKNSVRMKTVPYFCDITYRNLPETTLPRLPFKIPVYKGDSIWLTPGPCHSQKNVVKGAARAPNRTVYFGSIWADWVATNKRGMPPPAFINTAPMSDLQDAWMVNPYCLLNGGDSDDDDWGPDRAPEKVISSRFTKQEFVLWVTGHM